MENPSIEMPIEDAVAAIIGDDLAKAIIDDKGIHWAVVAAMAEAKNNDDPRALEAINRWRHSQ